MKDNEEKFEVVDVFAALSSDGKVLREQLPARNLGNGNFELLASPGLALNLAKGDIIRPGNTDTPVHLAARGGNLCVQIFADILSEAHRAEFEHAFRQSLPGSFDGGTAQNMTFSVPVSAGFPAVENFFNSIVDRYGAKWYYGNVYSLDDGVTPLNWWSNPKYEDT
jgi:hypothetical protein